MSAEFQGGPEYIAETSKILYNLFTVRSKKINLKNQKTLLFETTIKRDLQYMSYKSHTKQLYFYLCV